MVAYADADARMLKLSCTSPSVQQNSNSFSRRSRARHVSRNDANSSSVCAAEELRKKNKRAKAE